MQAAPYKDFQKKADFGRFLGRIFIKRM